MGQVWIPLANTFRLAATSTTTTESIRSTFRTLHSYCTSQVRATATTGVHLTVASLLTSQVLAPLPLGMVKSLTSLAAQKDPSHPLTSSTTGPIWACLILIPTPWRKQLCLPVITQLCLISITSVKSIAHNTSLRKGAFLLL